MAAPARVSETVSLHSRLPEIERAINIEIDRAVDEIADAIVSEAKARAPVESGALRDSIHSEIAGDGVREVLAGNTEVDYGLYVEFGTQNRAATPYFVPAVESARAESRSVLFKWIKRAL